jgi:hypothetical protein
LNCKNIVTEFLLSLKFMSTHWDLLDKGDSQEPQRVVDEEIGNE